MNSERFHILNIFIEVIFLDITSRRTPLSSMIPIDDLGVLAKGIHTWSHHRVFGSRPAVRNECGRALDECPVFDSQRGAENVKENLGITYFG